MRRGCGHLTPHKSQTPRRHPFQLLAEQQLVDLPRSFLCIWSLQRLISPLTLRRWSPLNPKAVVQLLEPGKGEAHRLNDHEATSDVNLTPSRLVPVLSWR